MNYPTIILAEYIQSPVQNDRAFAAAFYGATFVAISIAFQALWRYATHKRRLLSKKADPALVVTIHKQYRLGPLFYLVAFALAFLGYWGVWASVAVNGGLAVYFAFTGQTTRIGRRPRNQQPEQPGLYSDQASADSAD